MEHRGSFFNGNILCRVVCSSRDSQCLFVDGDEMKETILFAMLGVMAGFYWWITVGYYTDIDWVIRTRVKRIRKRIKLWFDR